MPRRKIEKDNMPICCLGKIGSQYIHFKVLSVLEDLNASGREDIVNSVIADIHEKTQLQINSNSITNVDDNTFMESELFKMQEPHNINTFSIGVEQKRPQDKFVWKKNGKFDLEIEGDQKIEGDQSSTPSERLGNAAKQYLKEGTNYSDNNPETKERRVKQITDIIDIGYQITISKIVVIAMKDHQGSLSVWEEHILIITSLVSLLVILLDLLTHKYESTYNCEYKPYLPGKKTKKKLQNVDNVKREELDYAFPIKKVYPLTRNEMEQALMSKLDKLGHGAPKSLVVLEVLAFTNMSITKDDQMDQRCRSTDSAVKMGVSPDGRTTPHILSKSVPQLAAKIENVKTKAQDECFRILQDLEKLPMEYSIGKGYLHYNSGEPFSSVNFCNVLDKVTITYLLDRPGEARGRGRPKRNDQNEMDKKLKKISPLVVQLLKIIFSRLMCSATYEDDLTNKECYDKWREHAQMIISCVALLVAVLEYTGCTRDAVRNSLEKSCEKAARDGQAQRLLDFSDTDQHIPGDSVSRQASCSSQGLTDTQLEVNQNLAQLNLKLRKNVPGDGNCFFAAVEDQLIRLKRPSWSPRELRRRLIIFLENLDISDPLKEHCTTEYIQTMSKDGEWVDHVAIKGISRMLEMDIHIVTSQKESTEKGYIITEVQCSEDGPSTNSPILLGHIGEFHYVSVEEQQSLPLLDMDNAQASCSSQGLTDTQLDVKTGDSVNTGIIPKEQPREYSISDSDESDNGFSHLFTDFLFKTICCFRDIEQNL